MDLDALPAAVARPAYAPSDHGPGIVHLGLGAFFKAHLAVYTDDALAFAGGNWRIIGVSLRSKAPSAALVAQNQLYTCVERDLDGTRARVIGSIAAALNLPEHRADVLRALTDPATRIVSLTVTEKGYGLNRATGGVDAEDPVIAHDLANPDAPNGVAGLLVWALRARRVAGHAPFTVLSCDNMPSNGAMLRGLLIDFARRTAPEIASHIAENVAFPATMVDRITPASTQATLALAEDLTGQRDAAAVTCEGFRQWVIE
ncbi:MAG: mannitol dehydrogenase family protein, partial [Pseudomonadota bacterium]